MPILVDGDVTVWDSLAIIEYLAEKFPDKKLWPADRAARAHARAISAEMHSGFAGLRNECGMNLHRPVGAVPLSQDARDNIARVQEIWTGCLQRYGGPFLFGGFGGADAMYAPVVHRFRTYAIEVTPVVRAYMEAMQALAGVSGMDPRRAGRNARYREVRDGVSRTGSCARRYRGDHAGRASSNFQVELACQIAGDLGQTRPEPEPRASGLTTEIRVPGPSLGRLGC